MKKMILLLIGVFFVFVFNINAQTNFKVTEADTLFDNFEDGDTVNAWGGIWTLFTDGSASSTIQSEVAWTDGYNNSLYALHVWGQYASYGGAVGFLREDQGNVDFTGKINRIKFAAKGTDGPVTVRVREKTAETSRDYNYYGYSFTPTSEWKVYTIPFDSLSTVYGPQPNPPFDPTTLYCIDFGPTSHGTDIDVYIDDIYFVNIESPSDIKELKALPKEFSLSQNYPNPFNPATNIKFTIAKSGLVLLKVYNILGSEAAILVNEFMNPGSYKVDFNAASLSSGVYFYRLQSNGNAITKQMILLK